MTLSAKSGLMHRSKQHLYSITSDADRHVSKAREISAGPVKTGNEAFCHRIGSK